MNASPWCRSRSKRAFDVVLGTALLLASLPLLGLIALLALVLHGRPVLFRQRRPGLETRPFTLTKFRTMRAPDGARPGAEDDERRLTRFGRRLRASSLDELPELWQVVRGRMSLVGPRPLLTEYLPHYTPRQALRHAARPGMTGWAQVHGRNAVDWDRRLELDAWYVENAGPVLDLRILLRTPLLVLTRRGIGADGHATMPRYAGPGRHDD